MKKALFSIAIAALALTSCTTVSSTATVMDVETSLTSDNKADLVVSDQVISYTMNPSKAVRRGGPRNVKRAVVAEALKANGNGDVLVSPQYQITERRGLLGKKITSITVTGHVGTYKNFRSAACGAPHHK